MRGDYPKLTFKYGWDDRDDEEASMKGYRSDGIVQSPEGEMYPVYFIDPILYSKTWKLYRNWDLLSWRNPD